jgi:hypothetical protein
LPLSSLEGLTELDFVVFIELAGRLDPEPEGR